MVGVDVFADTGVDVLEKPDGLTGGEQPATGGAGSVAEAEEGGGGGGVHGGEETREMHTRRTLVEK